MLKSNVNVRKIAGEFMKKDFENSKEDAEVDFRLKYCNLIYTEANKYSVLSRMILDFDDDGLYEIKGIDYLCGVYFYVVKAIDNKHEHAHELLREFNNMLRGFEDVSTDYIHEDIKKVLLRHKENIAHLKIDIPLRKIRNATSQ
jgi:hypothetical protein